ncbi:DUF1697 domain-containing protein [Knoellia sp. p5-6-4]|uniref:DUF1697 domain-containing protein n=1 Tax=unclassified Knoellia TaxID=2618719 RepID=UPI0023D9C549|nr:DUF1697 domain-containing protein [Knoellia sp. p5-6-4]MDF2145605.1 DUF1697 domain-containing protein [Knoellia sp. p5-6-4]
MPTYVVLLRAVNVGKRILKMEHARKVLEDNAFLDVASHIQTGNMLVTTPMRSLAKVEQAVGECLSAAAGFDVVAMARRPAELSLLVEAADGIPPSFEGEVRRYVAFCQQDVAEEAAARLAAWEVPGERAHVIGRDVLVELGRAFHEARLGNAEVERITGAAATTRNLTVVRTLAQKWGT